MRLTALAALLLLAASPAFAETAAESVPACDSLVALRRLAVKAGEDHARAAAEIASEPGCRLVPRGEVGAAERRTLFGGAPYECLAHAGGPCLWVMP
jgi:hypothetical protein